MFRRGAAPGEANYADAGQPGSANEDEEGIFFMGKGK